MHTRNLSVGRQTLSIETGRLAKQADGAVVDIVQCDEYAHEYRKIVLEHVKRDAIGS